MRVEATAVAEVTLSATGTDADIVNLADPASAVQHCIEGFWPSADKRTAVLLFEMYEFHGTQTETAVHSGEPSTSARAVAAGDNSAHSMPI